VLSQELERRIGRAVVDDDHLEQIPRIVERLERVEAIGEVANAVPVGNDDRDGGAADHDRILALTRGSG
jgi:hypothetical protein